MPHIFPIMPILLQFAAWWLDVACHIMPYLAISCHGLPWLANIGRIVAKDPEDAAVKTFAADASEERTGEMVSDAAAEPAVQPEPCDAQGRDGHGRPAISRDGPVDEY